MKKLTFLILFSIACLFELSAQQYTIEYSYDKSGNREARKVIYLSPQHVSPAEPTPQPTVDILGPRKVEVFPNPTKGNLAVRITGGKNDESYRISVYTLSGATIIDDSMKVIGDYRVDLSQYENGIYILVIRTGKEKLTYKIVKE